ncbi:MAG: hypothetical protein RLZZ221_2983 [Verrucomicrobiota bacterium]
MVRLLQGADAPAFAIGWLKVRTFPVLTFLCLKQSEVSHPDKAAEYDCCSGVLLP